MSHRSRAATIGIMVVACLVFPREAKAGFWNFIWGLDPQLMGPTVIHCRFEKSDQHECRFFEISRSKIGTIRPFTDRAFWFSFEGNYFFSDPKKAHDDGYRWFKTNMVAFEPVVEFRLPRDGRYYFGAGATLDGVFTHGQPSVFKGGVKLLADRTFDLGGQSWDAGIVLRLYPHRFTAEDFGLNTHPGDPTGAELSLGFSINYKW